MAGIFHVEFGINSTTLTQVLERADYDVAEQLIRQCNNPSYLDEGCYQRTPMYVVLCGIDEEEKIIRPRNFYIARLLIEYGANINLRVPTTYFGCEYMGPGKSPLELLVDFYNDITKSASMRPTSPHLPLCQARNMLWDPQDDVIGLNKQNLSCYADVIEHIHDLIFILLRYGANSSVQDVDHMTPLHRLAESSCDLSLFKLLCDNGADVNARTRHGNTPLLSLCDVSGIESEDLLDDLSPCSDDELEEFTAPIFVKQEFLRYLLNIKDIDVNAQNRYQQTALFHTVIRGDVDSAALLLKSGANPTLRGNVWETRKKKRRISPLFCMFLSIPIQRSLNWHNMAHKLTSAPECWAQLVDAGHFSQNEIMEELIEFINTDFPEFSGLCSLSSQLINLMFGRSTSTLKQLSARVIFNRCLIQNSATCLSQLLPMVDSMHSYCTTDDLRQLDVYEEYVSLILNKMILRRLLSYLTAPQNCMLNFEVELLFHRLACRIASHKVAPPHRLYGLEDGEDEESDDDYSDDLSEDQGDSDLEYW